MKRHARVKDIISVYRTGGMVAVARYLSDDNIIIEENTWEHKMKKLLESNCWGSMEAEIAMVTHFFNLSDLDGNIRSSNNESSDQGSEDRSDLSDRDRGNINRGKE